MTRRVVFVYSILMFLLLIATLGTATAALGTNTYTEAVGKQSVYTLHVATSRGTIYDRHLKPLTNTNEKYIAAVVPSVETLARIQSITDTDRKDEMKTELQNRKPFLTQVNSPISSEGIETFTVLERYSDPQPASNLIGYLENGTLGISGVEKAFDAYLAENKGEIEVSFTVDAVGQVIHTASQNVKNTYQNTANGIALTIDKDIQMMVEEACKDITRGAAVVMRCDTGEIVAMASFPALNPNRLDLAMNDADMPFVNRALSAYAPGSIFKLVVAAAALEEGVDYRSTYNCTGQIDVQGLDFACYDHTAHGEVNMHTALRQSCNGYYIQLGLDLGAESIISMVQNLGIGKALCVEEGIIASYGTLSSAEDLQNERALANFSFGQGDTTLTPLHAAAFVNAIAMGGEWIDPQLYIGTVDHERNLSGTVDFSSCKVMEATTANRLRSYMESTARFGTARLGAPDKCVSGIKTGTAQTGVYDEAGEEILNYWYVGYICDTDENPVYTIVLLEESSQESQVPQIFKKIADSLVDFI